MWFRFIFFLLQTQILTDSPIWIQTKNITNKKMWLTAFLGRLIGWVLAVCLLVAHFLHADTLPCFTLEHGGPFTCYHCTQGEEEWTSQSKHMRKEKQRVRRVCNCQSPLWQPSSSLRSEQWWVPSHWRAPAIQVPSRHLNWSWVQVGRPGTVKRSRSKPPICWEISERTEKRCKNESLWVDVNEAEFLPAASNASVWLSSQWCWIQKEFFVWCGFEPTGSGSAAEHLSSRASEYLAVLQMLFLSGTIGSALI